MARCLTLFKEILTGIDDLDVGSMTPVLNQVVSAEKHFYLSNSYLKKVLMGENDNFRERIFVLPAEILNSYPKIKLEIAQEVALAISRLHPTRGTSGKDLSLEDYNKLKERLEIYDAQFGTVNDRITALNKIDPYRGQVKYATEKTTLIEHIAHDYLISSRNTYTDN